MVDKLGLVNLCQLICQPNYFFANQLKSFVGVCLIIFLKNFVNRLSTDLSTKSSKKVVNHSLRFYSVFVNQIQSIKFAKYPD